MSATLEKALLLVEAMAQAGQPCGVTQLSRDLKLNKSTVYRLLDILCRHGYVRQDAAFKHYMLTTKLWELGVSVLQNLSVHSVAPPFLGAAAEETGETLLLTIPDDGQALVIDKVNSSHALQIFSPIGARLPLHCSSVGKAMMVDWSDAEIRRYAPHKRSRPTENSITSADVLIDQLREVRAQGYSVSVDEYQIGVSGVAAAVRDATGALVGTVGITGPTSRLSPGKIEPLGRKAAEVAAEISRALGFVPKRDAAAAAG